MQFSIKHLVVITLVSAFVFAITRIIGVSGTVSVLVMLYLFAPSLALSIARGVPERRYRSWIAVGILLMAFTACMFTCGIVWGTSEVYTGVSVGTAFAWGPQLLFILVLYAQWKSGLRAAGVDPDLLG